MSQDSLNIDCLNFLDIFLEGLNDETREKTLKRSLEMIKYFSNIQNVVKNEETDKDLYLISLVLTLIFVESVIVNLQLDDDEIKDILSAMSNSILSKKELD